MIKGCGYANDRGENKQSCGKGICKTYKVVNILKNRSLILCY